MSAVKRLMEDLVEREDDVLQLINLAKEKRPALYKATKAFPTPKTCLKLFSGLTDNRKLEKLASAAMYWNFNFNDNARIKNLGLT